MSYVDVLIPGLAGLFILVMPTTFVKRTGDEVADAVKFRRIRMAGIVLLGVAGLYLLIKFASPQ